MNYIFYKGFKILFENGKYRIEHTLFLSFMTIEQAEETIDRLYLLTFEN